MCGAKPKGPKTVKSGPSQGELQMQMQAQQDAQSAIQAQNNALVLQMQEQAAAIQADTARRAEELAAARAPAKTLVNANPYTTTTGQGTAGAAQEQTTAPQVQRKPRRQGLQLTAEISMPGVGINFGGS